MKVCEKAIEHIKQQLITPPVLCMVTANYEVRLEIDTSKKAAGGSLFKFQKCQWVLFGYHSKKMTQTV